MSSTSQEKIKIVTEFLERIGRLDIRGAGELLHEDAVMMLPYVDPVPDVIGKQAIIEQLEATTPKMLEYMKFTFDEWYPTADPNCLIVEYRSSCARRDRGGLYENSYISVFKFIGNKISLYKEYLNPLPTAALMGNMD